MQATILITALALSAPALKDPPNQNVNLAGEWVVESRVRGGRPVVSSVVQKYLFSADGKWTQTTTRAKITPELTRTFTIDHSKRPAPIDMKRSAAATTAAYIGIIKVEGDTMTLCYSINQADRPAKFESPENSGIYLLVLKRVKKE